MQRIFILTLLLSSCSLVDSNNIAPGYSEAFVTIKAALFGVESNEDVNREIIDAIPYASLILKIGNGPEGLMILESIKKDRFTWVSADGIRLVIQNGRIISSSGLFNNLKSLNLPKKAFDFSQHPNETGQSFYSYYTFSDPTLIDLKVSHTLSTIEEEEVNILGIEKKLLLYREIIESKKIRWKSENRYWLDENKFVWKSEQTISPKLPVFYYQITKKPSY